MPVNQSWLCDKGRFDFEAVDAPDRLSDAARPPRRRARAASAGPRPSRRSPADLAQASKPGAAGSAVGVIGGARLANEDAYAWAKLASAVIGTDNVDAQLADGLPAELVLGLPRATIDEACPPRRSSCWPATSERSCRSSTSGSGPPQSSAVCPSSSCSPVPTSLAPWQRRRSPTGRARRCSSPRSLAGTAVDGRRPACRSPSLARAGRSASRSGRCRRRRGHRRRPRPAVAGRVGGRSAGGRGRSLAEAWPGARFLPALRRANVHGALDMGLAPGVLPGPGLARRGRGLVRASAGARFPPTGALDAPDARGRRRGALDVLVLLGADPARRLPRPRPGRPGPRVGPRTVVAVDRFLHASAQLRRRGPARRRAYGERAGTTTNIEGRVSRLGQKIVPPGTARPDWMIAAEIAARLGADLGLESLEEIWDEIERLAPSHRGCTRRRSTRAPGQTASSSRLPPLPSGSGSGRSRATGTACDRSTPSPRPASPRSTSRGPPLDGRRLESAGSGPDGPSSRRLTAASSRRRPAAPAGVAGAVRGARRRPHPDGYSFRLVTSRSLYDDGHARPSVLRASPPSPPSQELRLRNQEVEQLGVRDGDEVARQNGFGRAGRQGRGATTTLPRRGSTVLPVGLTPVDEPSATALIDVSALVSDVRVETLT